MSGLSPSGAGVSARDGTLMLACLLIALPALFFSATAGQAPPDVPPTLDAFLMRVRRTLPPGARLLVAGNSPALALYRATYLLYPHPIIGAQPADFARASVPARLTWAQLQALANVDGAPYVVLWNMDAAPPGRVRLRLGDGILAETHHG
jgi:hypothetical protein